MTNDRAIMATLPHNMLAQKPVIRYFLVSIIVDEADPKHPSVEQLENRIGDGPQYFDGVRKVTVRFDGQRETEV